MLGATCSECCAGDGCPCMPETVTVDIGLPNWGLISAVQDYFFNEVTAPYAIDAFSFSVTFTDLNAGPGTFWQCHNPSASFGKCMRISKSRATAFIASVSGAYTLTRANNCKEYNFLNTSACDSNKILQMKLEILQPGEIPEGYGVPVNKRREFSDCGTSTANGEFSSYRIPGAVEYRLSAVVCISGDAGNATAQGCVDRSFVGEGYDITRCNCFPSTMTARVGTSGPFKTGPCIYNGDDCQAQLEFRSVQSFTELTPGAGNVIRQPSVFSNPSFFPSMSRIRLQDFTGYRATFPPSNTETPQISNPGAVPGGNVPNPTDPLYYAQWCDSHYLTMPRNINRTAAGSPSLYDAAQCMNIGRDVFFPLMATSPLMNKISAASFSFGNITTPYFNLWDMFGFGARLRRDGT